MNITDAIALHTAEMDRLIAERRSMILDPRHLNLQSREITQVSASINAEVTAIFLLKNSLAEAQRLADAAALHASTIDPPAHLGDGA